MSEEALALSKTVEGHFEWTSPSPTSFVPLSNAVPFSK
jgi:hypothetical protein